MSQETNVKSEEKLDFKKLLPVFVIILIDLLGMTIIIPILPLYAASFGMNAFLIGILSATYPVSQFIGAPMLGRLSDHIGRKPVLLLSQLGTFLGFLLLGFAGALPVLFLSRLIDGLSGANIATAQAVITDSTTEKTRTQGLGLLGAAFGLGFILGPMIAYTALALSGNDFHAPAFVAAAFSAASILLTWFWLKETHPAGSAATQTKKTEVGLKAMWQALNKPLIGFLLILMFAQQIAFGGFEQLLSLFTMNRLGLDASGNSVVFVFVGIIVVAVQGYFIGRWSRRFGDAWLIRLGLALLAVGLLLTAFTPRQPAPWYSRQKLEQELSAGHRGPVGSTATEKLQISLPDDANRGWFGLGWILIAMIPTAIGGGLLQPAINSLITQRARPEEIGGMLGISAALLSGANAIAPVAGGAIFQVFGAQAPFFIGGALLVVLWLVAMRSVKREPAQEVLQRGSPAD